MYVYTQGSTLNRGPGHTGAQNQSLGPQNSKNVNIELMHRDCKSLKPDPLPKKLV